MIRLGLFVCLFTALGYSMCHAGVRMDTRCYRGSCTTEIYRPGPGLGKTINVETNDVDPERAARIRKWEEFCKPQIVVDGLGVSRYRYAVPGCENGRSE